MKKLIPFLLTMAIMATMSLAGCYYDVENRLYPKSNCDTTSITYSKTVTGILQNYACLNCHAGTASSGGNIALDTYNGVKTYAQNGHLMGSINQQSGFSAMPLGGSKLNSCDINKIQVWINAGIPNN